MNEFVEKLYDKESLVYLGGVSHERIEQAERDLSLSFSEEYRAYLKEFGVAAIDGHEFTGICNSKRLDVVAVTKEERIYNPGIPENWYVVEQASIDGIIIWQNEDGTVYQTETRNDESIRCCASLEDYIEG